MVEGWCWWKGCQARGGWHGASWPPIGIASCGGGETIGDGETGVGGGGGSGGNGGGKEVRGEYGERGMMLTGALAEGKGVVGHGWRIGGE